MMMLARTVFLTSLAVLLTACSGSPAQPPVSAAGNANQPTLATPSLPTPLATEVAATNPVPTAVQTLSTSVAIGPTTSSVVTPNAAETVQPVTLVVDSSATRASYHAHERLVGRSLASEAVGTSKVVKGSIAFDADGSILSDQSEITVDVSSLSSDEGRRDNFIRGNTLQTGRYPSATFVPREAQGLESPLPTSGEATFEMSGDLTVHGVTRPVVWHIDAQFGDGVVNGDATTSVNISDFGMTPPKAGPVLSIDDALTLELAFSAVRQTD
jgi:polyisoprenoid-binding protein YceI